MSQTVTVKLESPIILGEKIPPTAELVFRTTVVAGDLRGIKFSGLADMSVDDLLKVAGRLSGQPDIVMNRLELADLATVTEHVNRFLNPGQKTPDAPSQS
jgi:tail assembly chaperone E/41/14-like protein